MSRMALIVLLTATVLSACDSFTSPNDSAGVTLRTVESSYAHGEVAEARLENASTAQIGHNLCLAMWERRTESGWERVVPLRMCAAVIDILGPGQQALLRETVEESWVPGTYRFYLSVREMPDGREIELYSNSFEVTD